MRYVWALFFSLAGIGAAAAQTERPEQLAQAYACRAIENTEERVACYDRAIDQMMAAEQQGQFVAVDRAQVEAAQRESFGFSLPSIDSLLPRLGNSEDTFDRVEVTVQRISVSDTGRATFYMSDGQVWQQVDPQRIRNVRAGDPVTIRRAALGTYMMISPRPGAGHRVRRQN